MNRILNKCLNYLKKFNFKRKNNFIEYKGLRLPKIRSNENLNNEKKYINSIIGQIDFLKAHNLFHENSRILDFGCGQGRLVNGLTYMNADYGEYIGLDTSRDAISWCTDNLKYIKKAKFVHLPSHNARYNDQALGLKKIPFDFDYFDLIFLNSVFSHMLSTDIIFYLNEFFKCLKKSGYIYVTAFIEENVPDQTENPEDYLSINKGPLHRVRFSKDYFFKIIQDSGFEVVKFSHQHIVRTKQSVLILRKSNVN